MAESGETAALRALVTLELRRMVPLFGRHLSLLAVLLGVLSAAGGLTPGRAAFVLAVVGGSVFMSVPFNALRDKTDGGLEFLCFLPASPETQTMARLLSVVGTAVPGALLATASVVLALEGDVPSIVEPRALACLFLALELGFAASGFLATALFLRFEVTKATYAPLVVLVVVLVLDPLVQRWIPDPVATLTRLAAHPWFFPTLWSAGLAVTALLGWFAFRMAASGIARHTPARDRMTW